MNDEDIERELLRDLLSEFMERGFPERMPFRARHKEHREALDRLEAEGLVAQVGARYVLTPRGLVACASDDSRRLIAARNELIPSLVDLYRQDPAGRWYPSFIAEHTGIAERDVDRALSFLTTESEGPVQWHYHDDTIEAERDELFAVEVNKSIEQVAPLLDAPVETPTDTAPVAAEPFRIVTVEVTGYRPFNKFSAALRELTVVIGANASGKSSLFDFLRFVSFAVQAPIPPEIDPRCAGRTLFHVGGRSSCRSQSRHKTVTPPGSATRQRFRGLLDRSGSFGKEYIL